jgi:hypothetical protein
MWSSLMWSSLMSVTSRVSDDPDAAAGRGPHARTRRDMRGPGERSLTCEAQVNYPYRRLKEGIGAQFGGNPGSKPGMSEKDRTKRNW